MKKLYVYLFVSIMVIVMSWEHQQYVSASLINQAQSIPEESIRLRVLAHSDSPQDQWLKREVRDAVVDQITEWVQDIDSIEEARKYIEQAQPEIDQLVQQTIEASGFQYSTSIEYGQIYFPVKLYGSQLYPAGEYEGILVTIGAGQGENWWCVLFPPLCFVDFGTGDVNETNEEQQMDSPEEGVEVEVRFFLADLFKKVSSWF